MHNFVTDLSRMALNNLEALLLNLSDDSHLFNDLAHISMILGHLAKSIH